ncbi:threonine-phosphate decarboxylase CobD [Fulvivirga kasyanovii]|uniref:Aminotransferase class I/II-fold pyridoxal phosphate-dependent enzyme n=1 Tax=Fulvivirga kasyanovii TaxID=396812 RepID=A0ABW9RJX4_9BACT|nr:aminotransferase class I/II-fold pyridoxal phosphate-dependent enzyme [Fulvivirga kasyanovii]MTI24241.1 aminotransferase class I/II-fold pyridoxal phosphate-dependent enzyme [Fulvivirga kasyanovii]
MSHGDDLYNFDFDFRANFSSNVWHGGTHPALVAALQNVLGNLQSYPAPDAQSLTSQIALHHHVESENVVVTNGAVEAFYLIAHAFRNSSATIYFPTFSEYEAACRSHAIKINYMPRHKLSTSGITSTLAFICNPNNPDGQVTTRTQLDLLVSSHPDTVFVIDEAYGDFVIGDSPSCVDMIGVHDNVIIVKSLTKLFAIPSLRLGYMLCSPAMQQKILACKMPWNVNQIAIEAGKFIFDNYESIRPDIDQLMQLSQNLRKEIDEIKGLSILPSSTHYFLVRLDRPKASDLKQYLAYEHRLLIRDASNFYDLDQYYIRISPQTEEKNLLLVNALKTWSKSI